MIQQDLFNTKTFATIVPDVKKAMNETAKESKFSREQIVDRMNDLAGRYGVSLVGGNTKKLTPETLVQWLKPSEPHRYPSLAALVIFCAAADGVAPVTVLASLLGITLISESDTHLLKWAKAHRRARSAREEMRKIEAII